MKFWLVDAFASRPFTGNQAVVCVVEDFPEVEQKISAEFNVSETVFVKPLLDNRGFTFDGLRQLQK